MSEEPWARVTLVIKGPEFTPDQVEQRLETPSTTAAHKRGKYFSAELGGDSAAPLDDQLAAARDFLGAHVEAIRGLPGEVQVYLHVGWAPRSPQDGTIVDSELIALLSRAGGYVLLDTYIE